MDTVANSTIVVSSSIESMLDFVGWGFIIITVALIIIPYLRGKSDLVSAWNFLLTGCAMTLGAGCLEAADRPKRVFEEYVSFEFPTSYYNDAVLRVIVFFLALLFFYYGLGLFRGFSQKRFIKTPEWSSTLLIWVLSLGVIISMLSWWVTIPFFGELLRNLSHKSVVFATGFAFFAWYRNRKSIVMLLVFLGALAFALGFAMLASMGRRLLLTVFMVPMVTMYWVSLRYVSRKKVLLWCCVLGCSVITVGLGYQTIRHFSSKRGAGERTLANFIKEMEKIKVDDLTGQLRRWKEVAGQGSFDYGLVARRLVDTGVVEPRPLNSLQFLATYPIPRRLWSGKPMPLGTTIVTEQLGLVFKTNWGLGPHGHSYYEGDYLAIFVYAAVLVLLVRLMDEPLKREPNNPFFIACLAAASFHIVNIVRGDLGVHLAEVFECFVYTQVVIIGSRLFVPSRPMAYMPKQWTAQVGYR